MFALSGDSPLYFSGWTSQKCTVILDTYVPIVLHTHIIPWFYFLNTSRLSSYSSILAVITLDQADINVSPASLQYPDLPTYSSLPLTHLPHCSQCDLCPAYNPSKSSFTLRVKTQSLMSPRNKSLCSLQLLTSPATSHFLCSSWLAPFPLAPTFFNLLFLNNFRHTKNGAKIVQGFPIYLSPSFPKCDLS